MSISEKLYPNEVKTILTTILNLNISPNGSEQQTILSPLRDEQNPSFSINIKTGYWTDHGTNESGDIITLLRKILNISFYKAVKKIEPVVGRQLLNLVDQTNTKYANIQTSNYSNGHTDDQLSKDIDELIAELPNENDRNRLTNEPHHPLLKQLSSYDLISKETLERFNCGIKTQWDKDWLSIPYPTGMQLYRRENGEKVIRMMKGSKPKDSWFGTGQLTGKSILFICKSPREAMMLSERYSDVIDVISIASGEIPEMSDKQANDLKRIVKHVHTIKILFDCDTNSVKQTAHSFTQHVNRSVTNNNVNVELVNISKLTNNKCKDITDYFKQEPDPQKVYKKILAKGTTIQHRKKRLSDIFSNEWNVQQAKPHGDKVFERLPKALKEITDLFPDQSERDVFLNAALPVLSAHLPNVHIPHRDGAYSPDLYTIVIAKPGSGKGIAEKARKIGHQLNNKLIEDGKKELLKWEGLPKKDKEKTPKPIPRQLFLPGNTSSRALYDFLAHNDGRGLIFETEIDTLVNATRQDWGDFTDVIRKGFHHEPSTMRRKNDNMYIERPELSIFMSGTFDQFSKLFDNAENGHFSRYAYYTFESKLTWKTHRPTNNSQQLAEKLDHFSSVMFKTYNILKEKESPLVIQLEDRHWDYLNDTFMHKMQELEDHGMSRYLQSNNQRIAVIALRIAAIMCIVRNIIATKPEIVKRSTLIVTNADMEVSIGLAQNFLDHAIRLFHLLPGSSAKPSNNKTMNRFFYALPERFETNQAYFYGYEAGIPERTVRNYLKKLCDQEFLYKKAHGSYVKTDH
ncbi:DUF3987 domain-containing protein [Fodinibius sp. Rm-B-1B1-1]|uniref:DUF3987 domain-containing protein n=1 Tax=Fodinibius alkaliphilus TaxID=3140241 RepID=UPI00315A4217